MRAKMVDWMIEVLASFNCSNETFFMAVNLMDRYLEKNLKYIIFVFSVIYSLFQAALLMIYIFWASPACSLRANMKIFIQ